MILNNCYDIAKKVRIDLNEYSDAYLQSTDTSGKYRNDDIIRAINDAQRYLWALVDARDPHYFLTSTTITGVASVYTLPSDFHRIRLLEDASGNKVSLIDVTNHHPTGSSGSPYFYYWKGSQIVIDQDSFTDTLTLWYYRKCRNITYGQSTAGGALSLTLGTDAVPVADYYNNMVIENITDVWTDTITDYSAGRVATLALKTGAASKWYGLVSDLPEDIQHLIAEKATLIMKELFVYPKSVRAIDSSGFEDRVREALRHLFGTNYGDVPVAEIFE